MMVLLNVSGKKQYLVLEDMTNIDFLASYLNSKPWTSYIDELLSRMGDIRNIEAELYHLLATGAQSQTFM